MKRVGDMTISFSEEGSERCSEMDNMHSVEL